MLYPLSPLPILNQLARAERDEDTEVKVLSEQIEHHVEEEEKRMEGLFSQGRKAGVDMDSLGEQLAARKAELMAKYEERGLDSPTTTTFTETTL